MGWWAVKRGDEELIQGDEPYDILAAALENIVREYEKDSGRRPTLRELLLTVEVVLAAGMQDYASDGDHLELVSVTGRTKKRRKQQPFRVGDFIAIPLPGGLRAFGRALSDVRSDYGLLVGIYQRVSRRAPRLEELQGGSFMFDLFYFGRVPASTCRWRVIGNLPVLEHEFSFPRHKLRRSGGGWIIQEGPREYPATEDQVRQLGYPQLCPHGVVERRIVEWLRARGTLAEE